MSSSGTTVTNLSKFLDLTQAEGAIKRYGLEGAVEKEVVFYDSFILQTMLSHYNEEHLWDIGLVHKYLPRIKGGQGGQKEHWANCSGGTLRSQFFEKVAL